MTILCSTDGPTANSVIPLHHPLRPAGLLARGGGERPTLSVVRDPLSSGSSDLGLSPADMSDGRAHAYNPVRRQNPQEWPEFSGPKGDAFPKRVLSFYCIKRGILRV